MDTTWIEVGGLAIRAPVTAGTNLLLSMQCAIYARRLADNLDERSAWWGRFCAAMALATAAGVLKHGFPHLLPDVAFAASLWTSNLAGGAAVYMAQRATIASRSSGGTRRRLERAASVGLAGFLAAGILVGPDLRLLIGYTAAGLMPVIPAEAWAACRPGGCGTRLAADPPRASGAWVAGGLVVALLTGLVYGLPVSLGRWFNHIDLAHVLMGASYFSIFTGVALGGRAAEASDASGERSPADSVAMLGALPARREQGAIVLRAAEPRGEPSQVGAGA
jgi:hypothetical protein